MIIRRSWKTGLKNRRGYQMKVSELIKGLEYVRDNYGDLTVSVDSRDGCPYDTVFLNTVIGIKKEGEEELEDKRDRLWIQNFPY